MVIFIKIQLQKRGSETVIKKSGQFREIELHIILRMQIWKSSILVRQNVSCQAIMK